ncbi:MAG: carboxylating nicotinate-nucleotide diphosphorylase [Pseudomonadota bacterium]|jgi:nicotinate-nucleotide pyrophosphorylase (carboxylating)
MPALPTPPADLSSIVDLALAEDLGSGDVTAALVPAQVHATAHVLVREAAVVCGRPWVDAVFARIDPAVQIEWLVGEGESVVTDQRLFTVRGAARSLLTAERSALNFMQTLSATATTTRRYVDAVAGTGCAVVDTRKTLPGLRLAQKYAVLCGGGVNHRIGLYDAFLIKENHIAAAGGIRNAIRNARALGHEVPLMTEAENLDEARIALQEDVDLLLVDDFSHADIRTAAALVRAHRDAGGRTVLEYSGGATLSAIRALAECGVDRISVGSLTKHVQAIDLSMRMA